MYRSAVVTGCFVLVAMLGSCKIKMAGSDLPMPTPLPATGEKQYVQSVQWLGQTSGVDTDLNAIAALDSQRAFVVGDRGVVLKTLDGGMTWQRLSSDLFQDEDLQDVEFFDALNGWVLGKRRLFHTSNGGLDWTLQHDFDKPDAAPMTTLKFVDRNRGYALNGGYVLHTGDGGVTWTADLLSPFTSLHALETFGTAVWAGGASLFKLGGGLPDWTLLVPETDFQPFHGAIDFVSPIEGWYVCANQSGLKKTENGGQTWQTVSLKFTDGRNVLGPRDRRNFYRVTFLTPLLGWLDIGSLLITRDGGVTWDYDGSAPGRFRDLQMVDANYGWGVGAKGAISRRVGLQL